jgi:pyrroloquinoline quinone biosynthesis protein D
MTSRERLVLMPTSRPQLARHAKLRFDDVRQRWLLLAPERLLTPSETAVAVLNLCDGARSIDSMATKLAAEFNAPAAAILDDILPVLQDLADKGYVTA